MRVILVTLGAPLPQNNAERWYDALIHGLVTTGHSVTVFAVFDGEVTRRAVEERFPRPRYDVRCFSHDNTRDWRSKVRTLVCPFDDLYSPKLREALRQELAAGYDVLHLEHQWAGWLSDLADPDRTVMHLHYLYSLDFAGAASSGLAMAVRKWAWFRAERNLIRRVRKVTAFSNELLSVAKRFNPNAQTHQVPLCFPATELPFQRRVGDGPPTVSLIGAFGWQPSWRAAERLLTRLWPKVKERVPAATLRLVGRKADDYAAHAKQQGYLPSDAGVFPDVPDTWPHFAATDVLLYAPPAGSGTKVKVLEAFALGTPVVTTASGIEGLNVSDGVEVGVCEENDGLIERTVRLLRDRNRADRQRQAARDYVVTRHNPAVAVEQFETVYLLTADRPSLALTGHGS